MSPEPESFRLHLQQEGYHPRSDKHSNALASAIASDLVGGCDRIRERAMNGVLVYDLNFDLVAGTSTWNVDLVLGMPPSKVVVPAGTSITRERPATVQVAVEIKSIMTEHRKAVKNRKRDLEAHHEHVHNYNSSAIAAGVFVINGSTTFRSPLRPENTTHRNPLRLIQHCISELRAVASRGGPTGYGLEAKCAIVIEMDNLGSPVQYLSTRAAPQIGDPLHYDTFLQTICSHYNQRF